jgi:hypothetical protein
MKQTKPSILELRSLSPVFDGRSHNERTAGWPGRGHGAPGSRLTEQAATPALVGTSRAGTRDSRDLASLASPVANTVSLGA